MRLDVYWRLIGARLDVATLITQGRWRSYNICWRGGGWERTTALGNLIHRDHHIYYNAIKYDGMNWRIE